ncbi:FRG domain-containing protein [Pararhizobium sp. LjRoot238]|uniref:FRG domain-containing protein n=1 Tax=Pararhizobium sp. LjRoot238 TaxID=3342293 RepID=UPI003ECD71B4
MPSTITLHSPTSFLEVMQIIETFQIAHQSAWYRGSGKDSHHLVPSLFRHPKRKTPDELHKLEKDLASTFAQRSPPFVQQSFEDEWERMFYMQHYGIPTRLLDWTESPFVALYFALTTCARGKSNKPSDNVAIWMLDPSEWNKSALSDISYAGGILDSKREQVKSYSPNAELDERKNTPIMIYGTHNSARIVAQRGMFALFGKSTDSMDVSYEDQTFTDGTLQKIVILKDDVDKVATSLFRKGISDSTVYPDLFGLSLELRRHFGF